jgi:5-methyltetrahydropteroyltriglutamate--homocysteine methyltransferase
MDSVSVGDFSFLEHPSVPEFSAFTVFKADTTALLAQLTKSQGQKAKPVLLGPVTYLSIGKVRDGSDKLALLPQLLAVYTELLEALAAQGVEWVQLDEPLLASTLDAEWQHAYNTAYHQLKSCRVKLLLTTHFGPLQDNAYLAANLPVAGLHVDAIHDRNSVLSLVGMLPGHKVLSLGGGHGHAIQAADPATGQDWLGPLAQRLGDRLWIGG